MRKTFRRFVVAVETGRLVEPFLVARARIETGIPWAGNFLAKHRVGNPGGKLSFSNVMKRSRFAIAFTAENWSGRPAAIRARFNETW
jgi:hypothetical protein